MSNDDYSSGVDAGLRGDMFGPNSASGFAGWMAGQATRDNARRGSVGSVEWLVAPVVLAPLFAVFYPVTTAATLAVAYPVEWLLNLLGIGTRNVIGGGLLLATVVVVAWTVGRRDQLWGLNRTYYNARHAARLVILALVANAAAMSAGDIPRTGGVGEFFARMFTMPNIMAVALMVVGWHLYLRRSYSGRFYWNAKLVSWKFRRKDFPVYQFMPDARNPTPIVVAQAPIPMPKGLFGDRFEKKD